MTDSLFVLGFVALLCSCFFAACTAALRTFSKAKLTEILEERRHGRSIDRFFARAPQLLLIVSTLRTLSNMLLVMCVFYLMIDAWPDMHRWQHFVVTLLVSIFMVALIGLAFPQSFIEAHPERFLARVVPVLDICYVVFRPVGWLLQLTDPVIGRLSRKKDIDNGKTDEHLADEILSVVEDHAEETGVEDDSRKHMLEGVIELASTNAGQIMTPRTDMSGIPTDATLTDIKQCILEHGHSRYPVYEDKLDHIVGVLYAKDLLQFVGDGKEFKLRDILRDPFMVPDTKPVSDLLTEFKARKVHIAIVLDEYGGTAGLVTIEDILEEIVGEIEDEYEIPEEKPTIRRIDAFNVEVDARVYVDDLNDELDLDLPEDQDFDTVGGFVFSRLGHIPEAGESFEYEHIVVTVTEVDRTKVIRVKIHIADPQQQPAE